MILYVSGMEDYRHIQNLMVLANACQKMLKEKFYITLSEDKLHILIDEISKEVLLEYGAIKLRTNQLNNITLSKIKQLYETKMNQVQNNTSSSPNTGSTGSNGTVTTSGTGSGPVSTSTINNGLIIEKDILNDDMISHKLKELETRRKIIPNYAEPTLDTTESQSPNQNIIYKSNPISITLPSMQEKTLYKNFIINSLNRDWSRNTSRNNIKFNITVDMNTNIFYPQCILFPKYIKNMTPYVLMSITDHFKSIFYSFVCKSGNDAKWDTWYTVDDVENISLQNKSWSIKFYDFMNNELELGHDNISVIEVTKNANKYLLKIQLNANSYDNNFSINDIICIRTYNGKVYNKQIIDYIKCERNSDNINTIVIEDENNELCIDDFMDSKILNTNNQYSFIIKYHYQKIS
jgi:hypothetical protein